MKCVSIVKYYTIHVPTPSRLYNELSSGIELKVSIAKKTPSRYNSVFFFFYLKRKNMKTHFFPTHNNNGWKCMLNNDKKNVVRIQSTPHEILLCFMIIVMSTINNRVFFFRFVYSVLNQSNNWDPQFEFTYRGLVPMKGKPEPMKVWILTRKQI